MDTTMTIRADGMIRWWSVFEQRWRTTPAEHIPNRELAAMSAADRERVETAASARCESGDWSCEPACDQEGTVRMAYVPGQFRGTAEAAGTWAGVTRHILVCADCAEQMEEHDGDWCCRQD